MVFMPSHAPSARPSFNGKLNPLLAFQEILRFDAGARTITARLLGAISVRTLPTPSGPVRLHAIKQLPESPHLLSPPA